MNRSINKVAVLGSGVMGSQIACHFANIGVEVLLLDIVPRELTEAHEKKGISKDSVSFRNSIVNDSLQEALKTKPSPIYSKKFASSIQTGNFEDNLSDISTCDWIIEVVIENLEIKKGLFEKVEEHRKPGTLISSNTSGIPIHQITEGRSDDFKKHFAGTHFFNPPRYLALLEIIPTKHTASEVVDFYMDYGYRFLGKQTVLCKDTPAFIANRIGVFSIMLLFKLVQEMDFTVSEIDRLTGPILGRAKSATFRTCDVVGLDTLVKVAKGLKENAPDDERNDLFTVPDFVETMLENKWLGSKTGQGFYKKTTDDEGNREILALNLDTLEYEKQSKGNFDTYEKAKQEDDLAKRIQILCTGKDKAGEFYRRFFTELFSYVAHRIPGISDELFRIDDALRAGFGWKTGPFETWDILGVENYIKLIEEEENLTLPDWINNFSKKGDGSFYKIENGTKKYFSLTNSDYQEIPGNAEKLDLDNLRKDGTVWSNTGATIIDLGDGVLNLEFHTKMNTIGSDIITGINKAIDMAESDYKGLVISNKGDHFSAGANVGMIFMFAIEQEYDELDFAIQSFQKTMMRVRYSNIPVIAAPHNMALGGGCELSMHADKVIAHSELYMGLVEFGVGVIPGGGGSKEFALRCSDEFQDGDVRINRLREHFLTIGQAKVSTSAEEAFELGYLRRGIDEIVMQRDVQLITAKRAALELHERGYTKPIPRKDITVLGNEGLGIVYVGANSMKSGNYISEHDQFISEKLGWVLCGGDLSEPTEVSEEYLLKLERKAFLELCTKKKTLERLQSIIKTGKVLRN